MSTPEEKREKKAQYNKNHREKKKLQAQKNNEESKEEIQKEEIKEIEEIEEIVEKKEEIEEEVEEQEVEQKVTLSREDYEWLIEQVQKQTVEKPVEIAPKVEPVKSESFFFRLQNSIKNQMISSIASMGSVLALSLVIRGSQSLIQSMNKSSDKSLTSTISNNQQQQSSDMFMPRIVNVG